MAKINFGIAVADARGKVSGNVFSKSRAGAYIRRKSSPVQPRTSQQLNVRSSFTDLTKRWGSILTSVQRAAWISFASSNPTKNVFGNTVVLTGLQMYMSVNRNLATIGVATIDDPPGTLAVGSPGAVILSFAAGTYSLTPSLDAGTAATFTFTDATGSGTTNTYTVSAESRMAVPGERIAISGFVNAGFNGVFTVVSDSGTSLVVTSTFTHAIETHAGSGLIAAEHVIVLAAKPLSPGRKFLGNQLRVLKTLPGGASPYTFTDAEYADLFGDPPHGSQVFAGVAYVSDISGARSSDGVDSIPSPN